MRGTAAILVCLISLHYLSVIDAYSARFTSENGMPGREHEDKHPRKSTDVKRSLPEASDASSRQYYNYDGAAAYYGGIPNIPYVQYPYRNYDVDIDTVDADTDTDIEHTDADSNKNTSGISKTLERLLNSIADTVRQLWGKLNAKPYESVEEKPATANTKRKNSRNEPSKKRAMENCNGEGSETTNRDGGIIDHLTYLTDMAKKALEPAYGVINGTDVSKLSEESRKMKEAAMETLKKAKDAMVEFIDSVVRGVESGGDKSPSVRRTRSAGKRTNTRDALEAYLTSLKSQKRSKMRKSHRRSEKGGVSASASQMMVLLKMMTEMEKCIIKLPGKSTSRLGVKCIVLPLMKYLATWKRADANGLTMDANSNVRSNKIESPDNLINFPWGSIFLIPIYEGHIPNENTTTTTSTTTTTTTPTYPDQTANLPEIDNVTTTTTEPPTTTTTSTTEAVTWRSPEQYPVDPVMYPESDKQARDDSRYRSKYDNDF